jgi:transcriptional regulator with XRE-family HTH domain
VSEGFGALLRRHRLAASLTQEVLAEHAAVSATAIAALERGRRRAPRLSTLRQIARALDLSAEQLAELAQAASSDRDSLASQKDEPRTGAPPPSEPRSRLATSLVAGDSSPPERARRWRTHGRSDNV